jgi:hypothetical protein
MQEKEGPRRLQLVEGFAHIDRDHRAVLGVLADLASRVARSFLALAGDRSSGLWRHVSFGSFAPIWLCPRCVRLSGHTTSPQFCAAAPAPERD